MMELRWVIRSEMIDESTGRNVRVLQYRTGKSVAWEDMHTGCGGVYVAWGDWQDVPTGEET